MSEQIVSPGVFTRETDLSFLTQGVGAIGAAIIGPFSKGPAFIPTVVNTQQEFEQIFGRPDGSYYTGVTVQNYLREAGTVTIVRVAGTEGYSQISPYGIFVSGSGGRKLVTSFHSTAQGDESVGFTDTSFTHVGGTTRFEISGSDIGVAATSSILPSDGDDVGSVFGLNALGTKPSYLYTFFQHTAEENENTLESSDSILEDEILPTQDFTYEVSHAITPWIQSQLIAGERYDLFRFHTIGDGNSANREFKIGISNVKPAGTVPGTDFTTFTVTVRSFSDTDNRKNVLETFQNATLDPASPNYIARLIGDKSISVDSNGKVSEEGTFQNNSSYVRAEVVEEGKFPSSVAPFGHAAYFNTITLAVSSELPTVVFSTGSLSNTGTNSTLYSGFDFDGSAKLDNIFYLNPLPESASVGANESFGLDNYGLEVTQSVNIDDRASDISKRQFVVGFQGGFDGQSPATPINKAGDINSGNSQGFNLTTSTSAGSVSYTRAINSISNQDEYDINLVVAPGIIREFHGYVFDRIVDLVDSRQDCFFIGDVVGVNGTVNASIQQAESVDSSYVGTYYPWVTTIDVQTNKQMVVPPSVLMPAIYASNDRIAAEWFAPAGLNRGGIVGAIGVKNRLTHIERDQLYEGKVNPIASFPGQGIVAYGQKTLQTRPSALDRINVRRLLIKVKKYIASTSRFLVFEQNSSTTRNRFLNTVNPYLESIQQRQGLYAFRVVMDETNNDPATIDRNILKGDIFIQPTRTAEFIVVNFTVLPTGATFSD